ncbi:hypothetical protein [Phenylobacterium sp.]|jgi:hypothetical protein|uniref:hypothetical protein n=1 Tax=Phenylobacterium sp. TaxID=1871053 RepID=UPI002F408477
MAALRNACGLALILALAAAAEAAPRRKAPPGAPADLSPADAAVWPYPPPDPRSWWDDDRPRPPEAADPLGGRRLSSRDRLVPVDNGIEPTVYRLWGLQPLQTQPLTADEMVLEVWTRPARSVRQAVIRVTVRSDGRAFVQARAGYACCEPGVARRVGFDAGLPAGAAASFLALRVAPMWDAPRDVRVIDPSVSTEAICVDGVAYDLTLLLPGRSRSLRRACDEAAIGQAADALGAAFAAALGQEPRFDVLFPGGAGFAAAKAAYQDLLAGGGGLQPAPRTRPQPPGLADQPAG